MKKAILTTVLAVCAVAMEIGAASPPAAHEPSAILLENGNVLRGEVADEGDHVLIKLAPGSQLRLPSVQVVAVARSLGELYTVQRRRIRRDDIKRQVELARWCQRHDLTKQAGEVLVDLASIAPDDPQVKALEVQLRRSLESYVPAAPNSGKSPSQTVAAPPPNKTHTVSPEALTQFTQQIQPMLNNHCGASGCHGVAAKTDFQFLRPLQGGRWTQRMTHRNLQAALAHVEFSSAEESPLLLAATGPHGGLDKSVLQLPQDSRSLEALRAWLVAAGASDAATPKTPEKQTPPTANADLLPQGTPLPKAPPTVLEKTDTPFAARASEKQASFRPRDAFDPEIFNRQFFPERFEEENSQP